MSQHPRQPDDAADDANGVAESRESHKQDETAKQRPGQDDLKVHDAHSRRPKRQHDQDD